MKDALIKSIQKWQDIVDGKNTDGPDHTNCPLCEVFYGDYCNGCPVMEKTGREFCRDTPYHDAWNAWCNRESDPEEYIEAANEELDIIITAKLLGFNYWCSNECRLFICSTAVSFFLNKTPPKITVSLTEEKPKSKAVKVGIIDCEKVEILESDLACYEKNEHVAVFTKLTELIANNFPTETCWISIHEN